MAIGRLREIVYFPLGETVGVTPAWLVDRIWGDVDWGDVAADAVDALAILRRIAGFPVNQELGCPEIGADLIVSAT